MKFHPRIATAALLCALWLVPSAGSAQETQKPTQAQALARQFMRCSFVTVRLAELEPDKAKADRATSASMVFLMIGAPNAAGQDFVKAELGKVVDSFGTELNNLRKRDPSPKALDAFLREQNTRCVKLYNQHRARYFAR